MMSDTLRAVILGIIEGVTEFLPVSSTGHLLLAGRFFDLGEDNFWKSFDILIQLGAILAIVVIYFSRLWKVGRAETARSVPASRHGWRSRPIDRMLRTIWPADSSNEK